MTKYLFFSILLLFFINITSLSAQPKGALAPKERDIEDAPEDSVAAPVYIGMSYEELITVFNGLKNYTTADPLASLRNKEKELLKIRDMAWRLVLFMEDPIKKRVAEGLARESHRATLLKAVKEVQEAQAAFVEDRDNRLKVLDSLSRPEQVETVVEEEVTDQDGDGWDDEPVAKEETATETKGTEVKEKGKKGKEKDKKVAKEKTVKEKKRKGKRRNGDG